MSDVLRPVAHHVALNGLTWLCFEKNGLWVIQWFAHPEIEADIDPTSAKWDLPEVSSSLAPDVRYWNQVDWHTFYGTNDLTLRGFSRVHELDPAHDLTPVAQAFFKTQAQEARRRHLWVRLWDFLMGAVMVALLFYVWVRLWA